MGSEYSPREHTRLDALLKAMRADANPKRLWSPQECAAVMGLKPRQVAGFTAYAAAHGVLYRMKIGRAVWHSLERLDDSETPTPVPACVRGRSSRMTAGWATAPDDPRIPKVVAGWQFPRMVAPRRAA